MVLVVNELTGVHFPDWGGGGQRESQRLEWRRRDTNNHIRPKDHPSQTTLDKHGEKKFPGPHKATSTRGTEVALGTAEARGVGRDPTPPLPLQAEAPSDSANLPPRGL